MGKSTGFSGRGMQLSILDPSTDTAYRLIGNLVSFGFQGRQSDEINVTPAISDDGYKDSIPGWKDPGSIPFAVHRDPNDASQAAIIDWWSSGEILQFRIDYAPGIEYSEYGYGYIINPGDISVSLTDPVMSAAAFRVKGATQLAHNGLTLNSYFPINSSMFLLGWI